MLDRNDCKHYKLSILEERASSNIEVYSYSIIVSESDVHMCGSLDDELK